MNGITFFRHLQTQYDVNPPEIVFLESPQDSSVCFNSGATTFVGIATAQQLTRSVRTSTGSFAYQWQREVDGGGYSNLSDGVINGVTYAGTATTTLTVGPVIDDTQFIYNYRVEATYIPSGSSSAPNVNPVYSNTATLTINPNISIVDQPQSLVGILSEAYSFEIYAEATNPNGSIGYQWRLDNSDLSDGSNGDLTVVGSATTVLSLTSNTVRTGIVSCRVSHTLACNAPLLSDTVTWEVVDPSSIERSILKWEVVKDTQEVLVETGEQNIFNNPLSFSSANLNYRDTIVLYAPEEDLNVRMTLEGAAGQSFFGKTGGQGGKSVFDINLSRNTEYVLKLGASAVPFGGRGGGGGAAYFYEKGQLLAVCGGGGGAGADANGGNGGGIGLAGANGSSGSGGSNIVAGSLNVIGEAPSFSNGGRVGSCTIGDFYQSQGISPCSDIGVTEFRIDNGNFIEGTATITRGYKAGGTPHRNNGGASSQVSGITITGGGGSGANGGDASLDIDGSGGGGSGYTNGTVSLVSAQIGGNTETNSKVTIELL